MARGLGIGLTSTPELTALQVGSFSAEVSQQRFAVLPDGCARKSGHKSPRTKRQGGAVLGGSASAVPCCCHAAGAWWCWGALALALLSFRQLSLEHHSFPWALLHFAGFGQYRLAIWRDLDYFCLLVTLIFENIASTVVAFWKLEWLFTEHWRRTLLPKGDARKTCSALKVTWKEKLWWTATCGNVLNTSCQVSVHFVTISVCLSR